MQTARVVQISPSRNIDINIHSLNLLANQTECYELYQKYESECERQRVQDKKRGYSIRCGAVRCVRAEIKKQRY